jgi:3-oxoacyl-[acyl-carrier protein] reductase
VLVTGSSTGVGAAVARGFAEQGAKVAIGYQANEPPALSIKREIEAAGGEALAVKGDVADPSECDGIVAETIAGFGRLDGLVNNAGLMLGRIASFEAKDEHVRSAIDLNARSVVSMTRRFPGSSARADSSSTRRRSQPATAAGTAQFSTPRPRASSRR